MGCERAPHNLGLMLSGGHGVEMDAREAWALFALAELRGNPQSHGRRIALEAAMTTTDLEHARQRLRALLPAPGTGGFTDDH
jgi:TPR repeat protein